METAIGSIEDIVDRLLIVLDADVEHVRASLSRLEKLRELVIKRDSTALSGLLDEIRGQTEEYAENESARRSLREELAHALGCEIGDTTLSHLESVLGEEKRLDVSRRKTMLRSLTAQLRKEHMSTALLLSDCARINGMLLNGILEFGNARTKTYGSDGAAKSHGGSVFVSMDL